LIDSIGENKINNHEDMELTIIIPVYNRNEYVQQCLKSVLNQDLSGVEIIVVDDGSDLILKLEDDIYKNVRVLRIKNSGAAFARNYGAINALGKYLMFIDSDDLLNPNAIAIVKNLIKKYKDLAFIIMSYQDFRNQEELLHDTTQLKYKKALNYFDGWMPGEYGGAGMIVISKEVFKDVNGFSAERINAEDHDLLIRVGLKGSYIHIHAPVMIAHRIHDKNEMSDINKNISGIIRLANYEKNQKMQLKTAHKKKLRQIIMSHAKPVIIELIELHEYKKLIMILKNLLPWIFLEGGCKFNIYMMLCLGVSLLNIKRLKSKLGKL
jgi:glycosyltransferase involved in cell wall biosynthesis